MKDTPERELLWFVSGSSSIKKLRDQKIGIWNSWLIPGSAKYEPLTSEEVEKAICKRLSVDFFNLSVIDNNVREALNLHEFTGDLYVFPHTADKGACIYFARHVWDGLVRESYSETKEIALSYIAGWFDISTKRLVDGDIGPGGYGPQWRHWKDTQIVSKADLPAYMNQGYKRLGVITPSIEPFGVEEIKAALHAYFIENGYSDTSIGEADSIMLPECGYEMVGSKGRCVHVLYLGEDELIQAYVEALDVPRFVMHREIDQLQNAINLLRNDPNSRRIIVTAWNPALTWKAALPPCHLYFQFISHELTLEQRAKILVDRVDLEIYDLNKEWEASGHYQSYPVNIKGEKFDLEQARLITASDDEIHAQLDDLGIHRRGLYCFLLLRSNDLGLGQPFNVAQYASMTHMVAQCVNMAPLELVWAAVDAHVYTNHVEALKKQLTLESKDCIPRIRFNRNVTDIDDFTIGDIEVFDYESHEALTNRMPVAV
ncbi:Thymidylate synthase [compost metagenome]